MTSEIIENFPPDEEHVKLLRDRTLNKLLESPDLYYESDIERFKTDDLFAHKFMVHQLYLSRIFIDDIIMQKAEEMIIEEFKWRKEFGVKNIKKEELPAEYFERKGAIRLKEDKDGRAVLIVKVKSIRKTKPVEKMQTHRFLVYWMENIYQINNYGITLIVDCSDSGWSNVNFDLTEFGHFIFRYHYPCFLGYVLVYNMPWLFVTVWNFIKRFLPQPGIDRIKFVDKTSILEYIDEDKLPVYLGGKDTSEFEYDENLLDTDVLHAQKEQALLQSRDSVKPQEL